MSMGSFFIGLVVGLILLVFAVRYWRGRTAKLLATQEKQKAELSAELEAQISNLSAELKEQAVVHDRNLGRLRKWAGQGLQWEAISRQHIVQACEALQVDGFVATNVCFMAQRGSRPYIHQIDHLVVTDSMLFVVESKYWKGRIFHRQRAEDGPAPFSIDELPIFDRVGPDEPYVLKIEEDGKMLWLPDGGDPEPVTQAQQQSIQLKNFLTDSLGEPAGNVLNCVLYSHPASSLEGGARSFGDYSWITQPQELPSVLSEMQQRRTTMKWPPVPVLALHELISMLGADIVGVGRYADQWQSVFPLQRQQRSSHEEHATAKTSFKDSWSWSHSVGSTRRPR